MRRAVLLEEGADDRNQRSKSIAVLDDEPLMLTCAYIGPNPLTAGLAPASEAGGAHVDQAAREARYRRRDAVFWEWFKAGMRD